MPLICHLAMSQRPYVLSRDENSSSFQWLRLFDSLNHLINAVLCIYMSFFTFCDHINDSNRVYFTDSSTELYSHCNLKCLVTPCKKNNVHNIIMVIMVMWSFHCLFSESTQLIHLINKNQVILLPKDSLIILF